MSHKKASHMINILTRLLNGETLTSSDLMASNSNQYFRTIKIHGIELVEVWKPNLTNTGSHKERSLHQTIENIDRANRYLQKLKGKHK